MDYERQQRELEEHKSRLEKAKDKLYTPSGPQISHLSHDESLLDDEEVAPSTSWTPKQTPVEEVKKKEINPDKVNFWFKKILVGAVVFFVLSFGVAAVYFLYGSNTISSRNIAIDVNSPAAIPSSDAFSFDVSIQNGNNADLLESTILIDYPEGTRSIQDDTKPLVSERIETGTVAKGAIVKKTSAAKLFGKENSTKTIKVTFQYKIAGSDATFSKESSFDVIVRLAPVVVSVDALREISSNQDITLTAKIISNSNNELKNVALNVVYPFGFTYKESNVEVESGSRGLFPVGNLLPNETKEVIIKGKVSGQSAENKLFKFSVGTADSEDLSKVKTILATYDHGMLIQNDFFASSVSSSDSSNGLVSAGSTFGGVVTWRNTLDVLVNDAEFSLKISGDLINEQGVLVSEGFYDSTQSIILWNKNTSRGLGEVDPGEKGDFSFSVPLASYESAIARRITNPKINLSLDIKGKRLTDNKVPETITSSFTKTIPIATSILFNSKAVHSTGPLKNTGPIPPRAESKTTYTITFDVSNSLNEVSAAEVLARLPLYVTYEGEVTPQSQKLLWNPNSRQLRWDIGDIAARTGYGTTPRSVSFKVGITPSKTQIGQIPVLVEGIVFKAHDDFADIDIEVESDKNLTTSDKEAGVVQAGGAVVQ